MALGLPFAEPTGYGLGKSGWVSFQPAEAEIPDLIQLKDGSRKATGRRRRAGWSRNWIPDLSANAAQLGKGWRILFVMRDGRIEFAASVEQQDGRSMVDRIVAVTVRHLL